MIGTTHHLGLVVSDLERSVAYYSDVLGMSELFRITADPDRFAGLLGVEHDAPAAIAFLDAGNGLKLELEEHASSDRNANELIDPTDVGCAHLCFEVDDIWQTYETYREEISFISEPGSATDSGATIVYFRDPDGYLIELIEFP